MKVFCKRTLITYNNIVLFKKHTIYESKDVKDYEAEAGLYIKIQSEDKEFRHLSKKTFDKYFSTIKESRDLKIDQILKYDK